MEYYILFMSSENEGLVLNHLKDGFKHVEVITQNGTYISALAKGLFLGHVEINITKMDISEVCNRDVLVVKYKVESVETRIKRNLIGVNTCVGITKDILGIRQFTIQTPYQLYKYLMNDGGEILCQEQK
tara:strand:- start:427 stop:813 length:387 start_codon:yes stop_codon:yes gene_type:complete